MLKNIVYNELNLLIEFIKLFPLMHIAFEFKTKPKKQIIIYSVSGIILAAAFSIISEGFNVPVSAFLCAALTIMILTGKGKIIYSVITYFGISMFDMLLASFMTFLLGYRFESFSDSFGLHLLANGMSIPIILILTIIIYSSKKSKSYAKNSKVGTAYLILILIGEISISLFITAFQLGESSDPILSICLCVSGIVFLVSGAAIMINYIAKNNYKSEAEINQNLLRVQENYYEMLLRKDKDTIKFRHDMNNHINCMYILFRDKKFDELDTYFEKMGTALSELRPTIQAGNAMLTAILNDLVSKHPQVKLEIKGQMPEITSLSNIDICTIFSNLLDNAISAAEKSEDKIVQISFKFIGSSLYCTIQNSVAGKVNVKNNMLETDKTDRKNHGFGTVNARECAEKYNGEITYSCDEHIFAAETVVPQIYKN